jgi:hypothetical protein
MQQATVAVTAADRGSAEKAPRARMSGAGRRGDCRYVFLALDCRNHWQPAIASRRLHRRPVHEKMLGEELTIFRGPDARKAIGNIFPRGDARLPKGETVFPGVGSCSHDGWTLDDSGPHVAALTDGAHSPIPSRVRINPRPAAERWSPSGPMCATCRRPSCWPASLGRWPRPTAFRRRCSCSSDSARTGRRTGAPPWTTQSTPPTGSSCTDPLSILFEKLPGPGKVRMTPTTLEDPEQFVSYEVTDAQHSAECCASGDGRRGVVAPEGQRVQ